MTTARHNNISVILLEQNLFSSGKDNVTIRQNIHIPVIFSFKQDLKSVQQTIHKSLGSLEKTKQILECYKKITKDNPYGYLVIDLHNKTDPRIAYRSNILVQEKEHMIALTQSEDLV